MTYPISKQDFLVMVREFGLSVEDLSELSQDVISYKITSSDFTEFGIREYFRRFNRIQIYDLVPGVQGVGAGSEITVADASTFELKKSVASKDIPDTYVVRGIFS